MKSIVEVKGRCNNKKDVAIRAADIASPIIQYNLRNNNSTQHKREESNQVCYCSQDS